MTGKLIYSEHRCTTPTSINYELGDVWQCDACRRKYVKRRGLGGAGAVWVLTFLSGLRSPGNQVEYDEREADS